MDVFANVSVMERQAIRLCGMLTLKHCMQNGVHARREETKSRNYLLCLLDGVVATPSNTISNYSSHSILFKV